MRVVVVDRVGLGEVPAGQCQPLPGVQAIVRRRYSTRALDPGQLVAEAAQGSGDLRPERSLGVVPRHPQELPRRGSFIGAGGKAAHEEREVFGDVLDERPTIDPIYRVCRDRRRFDPALHEEAVDEAHHLRDQVRAGQGPRPTEAPLAEAPEP